MANVQEILETYHSACDAFGSSPIPDVENALKDACETRHFNYDRSFSACCSGTKLNDTDSLPVFDALADNSLIESVSLCYNELGDVAAEGIASLLKTNITLKHLDLSFNDIGTAGGKIIAEAMELHNITLSLLNLRGNKIGNEGGMSMAEMLKRNVHLLELNLGDTGLETNSCIAIAAALYENENTALRSLVLDNPRLHSLQSEVIIHFADVIRMNNTLERLSLAKCKAGDTTVQRLMEALSYNVTLKFLDLSSNGICQEGAKHVGVLLSNVNENSHLEELNLANNRIKCEGAMYITQALRANRTLKRLNLTNNMIGDRGLTNLGEAVAVNIGLSEVFVWGNDFGQFSSEAWHSLLTSKRMESIEVVDVASYVVDGVPQIAAQN